MKWTPVDARRNTMLLWLASLSGLLAAWLVYRPDRVVPLDILDFSEFLPLVDRDGSFIERFLRFVEYYASQGRANIVPYALLVWKWMWFGDWTPGWQIARFATMSTCVVLCFRLLERLGATRTGALMGALLFVVHPAASRGWIRLTMAEPLGTVLLLLICLTLLGRSKRRWLLAVGLLVPLLLLTKEMLVATLALPAALLCVTDSEGRLTTPTISRDVRRFVLWAGIVSIVVLAPMAWLIFDAPRGAFATEFGSAARGLGDNLVSWLSTLLVFDPVRALPGSLLGGAMLLYAALIAVGWRLVRERVPAGVAGVFLAIGLLFPLVGTLVYVPWPAYQPFYAMPYLVGTAILIGMSASGADQRGGVLRGVWYAGFLPLGLLAVFDAQSQAARAAASQRAHARVVERVALLAVDSVIVPTNSLPSQEWQRLGPTLARYAAATGHPWTATTSVACTGLDPLRPRSVPTALVMYASVCAHPLDATPIVERYRRFRPSRGRLVLDSVRADVVVVPASRTSP